MLRRTVFRRVAGTMSAVLAVALALTLGLTAASPASAAEKAAVFIDEIADLPLMDGLSEVEDAGVSFDKPSGRIVEAFAHGEVEKATVRQFYKNTLPQLGWTRLGRDHFAREGEGLTLDYLGKNGDLTVRYTLQPR